MWKIIGGELFGKEFLKIFQKNKLLRLFIPCAKDIFCVKLNQQCVRTLHFILQITYCSYLIILCKYVITRICTKNHNDT